MSEKIGKRYTLTVTLEFWDEDSNNIPHNPIDSGDLSYNILKSLPPYSCDEAGCSVRIEKVEQLT